ncbi:pyridoxal phosphate-dependent aminotransferase [Haloarchaeobius iranensis]|uniref:Aminotransferase n=1 Tax=Haloarchaeobius iranensis TaxID=996166 RepID=A0A1G9W6N8_9EURY|nr:pyridoxal phosphate-dependent aminotransferase [Haloarchaeobius iranensis]SDM80150.1 Aspartate/methionine/tyrosine aminotransferase [Haloarchaeobius iranensis]
MFQTIAYLDWIDGRPAAAEHDLGSSDLRGSSGDRRAPIPGRLAGLADPPASVCLAEQVATAYDVDPENVLVTAGASMANVLAMATALGGHEPDATETDGSQVLVEKPGYEPLTATPRAFGGHVHRFLRTAEDDFRLDPDRVDSALADEAGLTVVTNRHNPSGSLSGRETLAATADRVRDAGGRLLVDEVYAPFTTDPSPNGLGGPTAAGMDDVVVTGSLTKFFGFGGLRVGWLVADAGFVERAERVTHHMPALAKPSVSLARRAFHHEDRLLATQRELATTNHDLLATFVDGRDDLEGTVHDGATYALLEPTAADGDTVAEAAWDDGVLVVPGRFFDEPDSVRVSLGRSPAHCEDALSAFGSVLDGLA